MTPLAVLTGIVLGSAVTITLGLAMVLAVFLILGHEYARTGIEMRHLLQTLGLFFALALVSSSAFWSVLRRRSWWWCAQGAMWLVVTGLGVYYWPG